jgi:hypothetical protein
MKVNNPNEHENTNNIEGEGEGINRKQIDPSLEEKINQFAILNFCFSAIDLCGKTIGSTVGNFPIAGGHKNF